MKNKTRGFLPVHEFGFCLCATNPKESLGCNVVKPWPPQGLVPTLRCPRCEAPVPLFIHKGYTRTSKTSTKLSYCCRGMCQAQIPQKKHKNTEATLIWMDRRCCAIPHQRSGAGIQLHCTGLPLRCPNTHRNSKLCSHLHRPFHSFNHLITSR